MFIPIEYFTAKPGQEMDLAPVIAMNFMRYKFFLLFSSLKKGGFGPREPSLDPPLVRQTPRAWFKYKR